MRVLVVDDHPLFRYGVRAALETAPDLEVVGEAAGGTAAIKLAGDVLPDVVVMDLHMPDLSGTEAIRRIVGEHPAVRVLVLTMFEDDDSVFAAMRAGARGYLVKASRPEQIVDAVHAVGRGEVIFSQAVATRLLDYFATAAAPRPDEFPDLTAREREVLTLLAEGRGNAAIARELVLSPKTVRNHVSNIVRKLQVADRAQAVNRAREAGWGQV